MGHVTCELFHWVPDGELTGEVGLHVGNNNLTDRGRPCHGAAMRLQNAEGTRSCKPHLGVRVNRG